MLGVQGASSPVPPPAAPAGQSRATLHGAAGNRLANTATEMEATFLSMLLKEMRQSCEEGGGFFPGDTGDVQGGLFDLYLGRHLADAGGVGLAAALVRQMQPPATPAPHTAPHDEPARPPHGLVPPPPAHRG